MGQIIKAYIRHYTDNGQTTGYVEWEHTEEDGNARTEGDPDGAHMSALFRRAEREGVHVTYETW